MAMANSWERFSDNLLARGIVFIVVVSGQLRSLRQNLWITGSGNRPDDVAMAYDNSCFGRRPTQR
jgi:hypothetical protein